MLWGDKVVIDGADKPGSRGCENFVATGNVPDADAAGTVGEDNAIGDDNAEPGDESGWGDEESYEEFSGLSDG